VFLARCRARVRRRARFWRVGLGKLLPSRTEYQLFGPWARYLEQRYLDCYRTPHFSSGGRERAALLLARHLSRSQQRCLRERGFFTVTGKSGRRFRVWARRQFPVELIHSKNSSPDHKPWLYCVHNDLSEGVAILPLADYLFELKLCLEAAEEYFLIISNPNFEQGQIEKDEFLRKAGAAGRPITDRLAIQSLAAAEELASESIRT
jgi:hypothetical protein